MSKELPKRSEVEEKDTWKLEDLYPSIRDWENDIALFQKKTEQLAELEGSVGKDAEQLLKALDLSTEMDRIISKAFNYSERRYDEDTSNTTNQAYCGKLMNIYSEAMSKVAFVEPEIIAVGPDRLEAFYQENAGLELYRKYLEELNRKKEHLLSAELEKMMAMTTEMGQVPSDTFSVLNNADMNFPEVKDENGEMVRLTHGRFISLLECSNREVREEVFHKYYAEYKQHLNTFASLYNGQVKKQIFYARMRKYPTTLEAAVDSNHVPSQVYHNLVATVNKNMDKLHRYVSLRRKLLNVPELHMYDIYTPMIAGVAKKYTYDEAKEMVLAALQPMGKDYLDVVKEAFANRWIDIYENQGKRSGAYSATAYGTHPYMLLNFTGSLDSVFTLIHEMGHSMHSYYSDRTQPYIYSQYKIFVAEVASTCNEVLLLEYLLKNTTDSKERAYLLNHYLDMFKGTLYRQTQFAEFEMQTNQMVEAGESLNADNLSSLYLELNKKYYGDAMISDDEIAYEWARIPHFYYNFYVYQYATSFAAAVAIAHNILEQGDSVVAQYKEFLSSGCSEAPVELLRHVGIDLEKPEPIQTALDVMDDVIAELEKLV